MVRESNRPTKKHVKNDWPELLSTYINNNDIEEKKIEENNITQNKYKCTKLGKDSNQDKKLLFSDNENCENIKEKCGHNHFNYSIGIVYTIEPYASYWLPGGNIYGTKCNKCKGDFLPNKKCKPAWNKPSYTCIRRDKGYRIAVCNQCFLSKINLHLSPKRKHKIYSNN